MEVKIMANKNTTYRFAKSDMTKEKFERGVYVEIYSAIDAPEEINNNITLSEPVLETNYLVQQTTHYDLEYSMEAGYDREEQYIAQEKKYDTTLKKDVIKDVVKTRKVTDWRPHSASAGGVIGDTAYGLLHIDNWTDIGDRDKDITKKYAGIDDFNISGVIQNVKVEREPTQEEKAKCVPLSDKQYMDYANIGANNGTFEKRLKGKLPGDKVRNFSAKWEAVDMNATVYVVDRYKLAFDCEGEKCFARQYVTSELPAVYCSKVYKDDVIEDIDTKEKNHLENDPEYQKWYKICKYGLIGNVALLILACILMGSAVVLGIILLLVSVAGFVVGAKLGKKMKAAKDSITSVYKEQRITHWTKVQNKKIELLNARFAKMGFAPLNEEELKRFDLENKHSLNNLYRKPVSN